MFYVIFDEEALPQPFETAEEAAAEGERLAREFEAKHARPASWFIAPLPATH